MGVTAWRAERPELRSIREQPSEKGFLSTMEVALSSERLQILGDNITLYQGVTLGGTGKEQGKRHPTLEDNVMVSAGAKVIGSFTIGENSKIGAGSVVL